MNSITHYNEAVKRVAIYCRVSSAEQRDHGISIDDQIETLTRYATENGYTIVDVYNDAGRTAHAKYTTRPELLRLLDDCRAGRVDTILFTRLDRWFRSVSEYLKVQEVLEGCGVTWSAILEDYGTETAEQRFILTVMLGLAQSEAERTGEKVKSVLAYKRARGEFTGGTLPLGYSMVDGRPDYDPDAHDAVQAMFDQFLTTYNTAAVMQQMQEAGYNLTRKTITRTLKNPAYTGIFKGYKIPPYITNEQHNRICAVIANRTRQRGTTRTYLFAGLVTCGYCSHRYTGRHGASGKRYVCTSMNTGRDCHNPSMSEAAIETAMLEAISADMDSVTDVPEIEKPAQRSTKSLRQRLDRLKELYLDGDISRDRYLTEREDLNAQIEAIENESPPSEPPELPANWREAYQMLTEENRQSFWRGIVKSVTITDKSLNIVYH